MNNIKEKIGEAKEVYEAVEKVSGDLNAKDAKDAFKSVGNIGGELKDGISDVKATLDGKGSLKDKAESIKDRATEAIDNVDKDIDKVKDVAGIIKDLK